MDRYPPPSPAVEALAKAVIDAAFEVHTEVGGGLAEAIYTACLEEEMRIRGIPFERDPRVPIVYKRRRLAGHTNPDFIVGGELVVELKAAEAFHPVHYAQILTYLHLTGAPLGLLLNFQVPHFRDGVKRLVRPRSVEPDE